MSGSAFSPAPVDPGTHVVLGTGPVGLAVGRELLTHDIAGVRLVSRSGAADDPTVTTDPRVEFQAADLSDERAAVAACEGATTITFALAPPYHRWVDLFPVLQANAIRAASKAEAVLVAVENLYAYGEAGMRAGPLTERTPFAATTRKGRVRAAMSDDLFVAHRVC